MVRLQDVQAYLQVQAFAHVRSLSLGTFLLCRPPVGVSQCGQRQRDLAVAALGAWGFVEWRQEVALVQAAVECRRRKMDHECQVTGRASAPP